METETKNEKRVLIIDDDQEIIDLIQNCLDGIDIGISFSVDETTDAHEGLVKLIDNQARIYSLVFIDLSMSPIRGDEIIKKVRTSTSKNAKVPFIIVSGYMESETISLEDDISQDVIFINKPFKIRRLQNHASAWLSKRTESN